VEWIKMMKFEHFTNKIIRGLGELYGPATPFLNYCAS